MTASPQLNRRSFLAGAAAIGGGLSLGFRIPFGLAAARGRRRARRRSMPGSSFARTTRS